MYAYRRVKSEPIPLFHSTFSIFFIRFGRKQVTISFEMLIIFSKKSKTNFEENAKCSWQRASSDDMISFLKNEKKKLKYKLKISLLWNLIKCYILDFVAGMGLAYINECLKNFISYSFTNISVLAKHWNRKNSH